MGARYIVFRTFYEIRKKTGLLKRKYPVSYKIQPFISLTIWKKKSANFFFNSRDDLSGYSLDQKEIADLKSEFQHIKEGKIKFFDAFYMDLGKHYDWITNPDSGYKYIKRQHWTKINEFVPENGDIKYVWEKSRFCYLYTIIRYDHHCNDDQAKFVFDEILSWIEANPLNCGPNYTSSQEIAIRVLNWIFALYYYKKSEFLTEEIFQKIINSIYWQTRHVEKNINFSLIAVRNNHTITENLLLYIVGLLFPFLPNSKNFKKKGKKYLEEEGLYQIYEDGSYLQFSFNYHRVVIQLYSWAFYLSCANYEMFSDKLYSRLKKSLNLLYQHQDTQTGMLPNYGANDGSLFFKLNNCDYRDFRPQLNALYFYFNEKTLYQSGIWDEDIFWYFNRKGIKGLGEIERKGDGKVPSSEGFRRAAFDIGGFYVLRNSNLSHIKSSNHQIISHHSPSRFAFIRCGRHNHRPSQADNLHLDIWVNGKNILRDAGSFKYNTDPEDIKYFMGTASHNTVMLGKYDQMEKGGHFIWYHWSQALEANLSQDDEWLIFKGKIHAFKHIMPNVFHTRIVKQHKEQLIWEVVDIIENGNWELENEKWCKNKSERLFLKQIWNFTPDFYDDGFQIICKDKKGVEIEGIEKDAFYSSYYGVKEPSRQLVFETNGVYFKTVIFCKF